MSTEKKESLIQLGNRLREGRKRAKLRQRELGKMAGCSTANISSIERGEWGPSDSLTLNLCRVLNLSQEWLTEGTGNQYNQPATQAALAWNDPPEMYTNDPKRIALLIKVKKLLVVADDRTIGALSTNVDEFMRRYEKADKDDDDKDK